MVPLTSCRYSILSRCWLNSVCHDRINTSSKIMYIAHTFKEIEIFEIFPIYFHTWTSAWQCLTPLWDLLFLGGRWGWVRGFQALTFCLVRLLYSFNFVTSVPSGTLHGGWTFLDLAEKNIYKKIHYHIE